MPRFVYKPEGVEPHSWDFDPNKLMNPEAEAIERLTGMTFGEWLQALGKSSMLALHGLLYVMLKRELPQLKWDDVQFSMSQVDIEIDDDEGAELLEALEARVAAGDDLSVEETALLAQLKESVPAVPKA